MRFRLWPLLVDIRRKPKHGGYGVNMGFGIHTPWWHIDKLGVERKYKGDSVIWLWPWKRKNIKTNLPHGKWLSIGFETYFRTLLELDMAWKQYDDAYIQKS